MSTVFPPQPSTATYPAIKLEIFPELYRGPNDPPYDATKRPKYWKDPAQVSPPDPSVFVSYQAIHMAPNGTVSVVTIWIQAGEAGMTNFPDPTPPNTLPPNLPPHWEAPIRPLVPGESLRNSPFGVVVDNTNVPSSGPGVKLDSTESAAIQEILEGVRALRGKIGA